MNPPTDTFVRTLQLVVENSTDAMFLGQHDGALRWTSPSVTALTGWLPEDLVGRSLHELIHPEDRAAMGQLRQQLESSDSAQAQVRIQMADGTHRWMNLGIRQVAGEAETDSVWVGVWHDISSQVAAQRLIAAKEEHLMSVLEGLDALVAYGDLDTNKPLLSGRTQKLLGFPATDMSIELWRSLMHPDDLEAAVAVWDSPATDWTMSYRARRTDGDYVWILDRSRRTFDKAGNVTSLLGVMVDITEQKLLEQELQRLTGELESAQRLAHVGSWTLDLATRKGTWSRGMFDILGIPLAEEAVPFDEAVAAMSEADRKLLLQLVEHTSATGESWDIEHEYVRADGSTLNLRSRGELHVDPYGTRQLRGTVADITDTVQMLEQHAKWVAHRTAYLSRVEHTMRTHLSVVEGWSQLLTRRNPEIDDEERQRGLDAIARNASVLVGKFKGLMAESKLALASEHLVRRPVDLAKVATSVLQDYQGIEPGISVTSSPEQGINAMANASALDSIIRHLVENATRYAKSQVQVECQYRGKHAEVTVSDDGPGLPKGLRPFEAFSSVADGSGNGLGLHVVQTLVDALGGGVVAESSSSGALFRISLPRA